ncbi:MAG: hypothetical protein HF967_10305, partial [Methanosarcinales archaeon]|nr:hypothetical protein [Methanosarcinales archaeon]
LNEFCVKKDNIFFTKVGTYSKEDVGSNCYHSKLGSLELFLHHYLDRKDDITFIDSTAGVDILGTSLFMSYDYLFFVVEPTLKSVQVFKDFFSKFKDENYSNTKMCIVGNKIIDETDSKFIEEQLKNQINDFFYIPFSNLFRKIEKSEKISLLEITKELNEELNSISIYINENYNKNWDEYKKKLIELHTKIAKDWYNDYYGRDIADLDIKSFTYEKQINN